MQVGQRFKYRGLTVEIFRILNGEIWVKLVDKPVVRPFVVSAS